MQVHVLYVYLVCWVELWVLGLNIQQTTNNMWLHRAEQLSLLGQRLHVTHTVSFQKFGQPYY